MIDARLASQIAAAPRDTLLAILDNIGATTNRSTKRELVDRLTSILNGKPQSEIATETRNWVISRMLNNGFQCADLQ